MKKLQVLLITAIFTLSSNAYTELVEVYTWKAHPGKEVQLLEAFRDAAEIHEDEGAVVSIELMNVGSTIGTYQYVLRWDSPLTWGPSKDKLNTSSAWVEFQKKYPGSSLGEMSSSLSGINLDQTVKARDFEDPFVYSVQVWEATPGKAQELLVNFMTAKSIIESTGARVEIYSEGTGGNGKFHYVLLYDNWSSMGKSYAKLGESQEWLSFQAKSAQGLSGTLVSSQSGQVVQ